MVALVATAGLVTAGIPATSASADTGDRCILTIQNLGFNQYKVTVGCTLGGPFSGQIPRAHSFTLYGADPFFDDTLWSSITPQFVVLGDVLNEDSPDGDEIYAKGFLTDQSGRVHEIRSNQISGNF